MGGLTGTVELFTEYHFLPSLRPSALRDGVQAVATLKGQRWPIIAYWHDTDPATQQRFGRITLPMGEAAPAHALPAAWYLVDQAVQWLLE